MGLPRYGIEPRQETHKVDLDNAVAFAIFAAHTGDVSPAGLIGDAGAHKYEVRLIRLARARPTDAPPIWLELYNHATQSGIDSCCRHDRAEAVQTAEAFVSRARKLDDES